MGRVIAVTNIKGGIGKTTTVVNVGAGMALMGARVLLVDVDAQGNLAMALGVTARRTMYDVLVDHVPPADCIVTARPNLDLLPANESLLSAQPVVSRRSDWSRVLDQEIGPLKRHYDLIFIDAPGSLTVLSVNALVAASEVIVPTTAEPLSLRGLTLLFKQIARITVGSNVVRMIVPTMFNPRLRQSVTLLEQLRSAYGNLVANPIRMNVRLSECTAAGRTIYEYDAHSRGALDYAHLVKRLSGLWGFAPAVATQARKPSAVAATPPTPANGSPASPAALPNGTPPVENSAPRSSSPRDTANGSSTNRETTCPNCGGLLRRATVAGYRVIYCDKCKYKQQELAGMRR